MNEGSGSRPLAFPSFRFYVAARALAMVASEMQAVAVGWQIYALTGRAMDLGLVGLAQFLPGIFLFLIAGHAADRFRRQRILQCCYLAFAVISALLLAFSLTGVRATAPIYAVLLLNGVVRAFSGPATQSFLPQLVPQDVFPRVVAMASSISQAAQILGPVAGGFVYGATGGPSAVYGTSMVLAGIAVLSMSAVRVKLPPRPRAIGGVIEGLRYLWRNKVVLGAMSLDMFAVLLGGAVALLPVFAKDILRVGATGLGILRGAPGAGAVLMAILLANRPLGRRAGAIMLWCVAGFGVFTIAFGLSRNVVLSVIALVLVGACDMVSVIVRHTLVQVATPDEMRGRVSAVNSMFIGASNEVGQFESGVTAAGLGAVPAVVLGGIGTIVVVALWAKMFPELRRSDRLQPKPIA